MKTPTTHRFCVVYRRDIEEVTLIDATSFADVEKFLAAKCPGAISFNIAPVNPRDSAWIEMRQGNLWYVSERDLCGFRRVTAYDCQYTVGLLQERCINALIICNALAGDRTVPYALIHAGFRSERLLTMSHNLLAEVKPLAIKAAVELRRYADDKTVRRFDAERALKHFSGRLREIGGAIPAHPEKPRKEDCEDRLCDEAIRDGYAVGDIEDDSLRAAYRRPHNPEWLRELATKWEQWAQPCEGALPDNLR